MRNHVRDYVDEQTALLYARFIGVVFLAIAMFMLVHPAGNFALDGLDFDSYTVTGRAEIRAYYVGTSLCVSWVCLSLDARTALHAVALVLGAFAATRGVGYCVDGVDPDDGLRFRQHAVCALEVIGASIALALMPSPLALGKGKRA